MARKPEPEKAANHERWLVSFADFMTLLFALFVVLFANSQSDEMVDVADLGKGIQDAFASWGVFPSGTGSAPIDMGGTGTDLTTFKEILPAKPDENGDGQDGKDGKDGKDDSPSALPDADDFPPHPSNLNGQEAEAAKSPITEEGLQELFHDLEAVLKDELLAKTIDIRLDKRGVVISLGEAGFFSSGSPFLKRRSLGVIDNIAGSLQSLKDKSFPIRIEGHTDNVPLRRNPYSRFQNNRELSMFRASSVLDRFEKRYGFPPRNLVPVGYGESRPIATNKTDEGRARNRRVDIVILNEEYSGLEATF